MPDYRVKLDIYNGPLDLLLYLIRRDEVDIYDIPIANITAQYVQYVKMLKVIEPNLAGDFLVTAAALLEIKTRMLLPSAPATEGDENGIAIDPRAELVRQLLEYKAFKDAAGDLKSAAKQQALKFARGRFDLPQSQQAQVDLEDVQVWDLLDAFDRLMKAIGQANRQHEVIYDDTPIELHAADIVDRLGREGSLSFGDVFEGRSGRSELLGLFLALLELIRRRRVRAIQESNFGRIYLQLNPDAPDESDEPDDSDETDEPDRPDETGDSNVSNEG